MTKFNFLTGIKPLTLKRIPLLFIVCFCFVNFVFSQTTKEMKQKRGCFLAGKIDAQTQLLVISNTFCIGDYITVKLMDNRILKGKINEVSQDIITTDNDYEIDVSKIKWIKKSKLTAGRAIVGGLVTAAGLALFVHVASGNVDLDQIALQGGFGIALVAGGIAILATRVKYQQEKGDKLIFNE